MSSSVKTVSNVFIIILFSKLLGQLREIFIAHFYGTGMEATAFYTAMQIPLSFFDMVLGFAIVSAFVPVFNEYYQKSGKDIADKFASNFITVVSFASFVITLFGMFFSVNIVEFIAKGLSESPQTVMLTSNLLKMIFPSLVFTTLAYSFAGVLQSYGEFKVPAAMSLVSNLITILYFIIFRENTTIYGVTLTMLLGWIMQFVILLPKLKKFNYNYTFCFSLFDERMIKVYKLAGPVILSSWVQPLNIMINLFLASFVADGAAVPAINYANRIYLIIASVFAVSLTNVTLPSLSRFFADNDKENAANYILNSLKATIMFLLPVMGMFVLYSKDVVKIIYESGSFDTTSTTLTTTALMFYSFGMLGYALNEVINKSFYAMQKSQITMKVAIVSIAINTICSFSLYKSWGIGGLAVSTSIATNVSTIILLALIKKNIKEISFKELITTLIKSLIAVILSLLLSHLVYSALEGYISGKLTNLLIMCIVGLVCVSMYVLFLILLRVKEIYVIKKIFIKEGESDE